MNSCEERNCRFWDGKKCNDPDEWINEGEDCCRYHQGATIKTDAFKQLQAEVEQQYRKGYENGLRAYAWWKDGVQYVGTCGITLKQALQK